MNTENNKTPWELIPEGAPNVSLEELGDIIRGLSRLFFSTFYVDLEQDTFRSVTQPQQVGDLLGNAVDCTSALRIYAQYFIHPDDQPEYLRVMNVDYIRKELRWWNPVIAVEYRRRGENPDSWRWPGPGRTRRLSPRSTWPRTSAAAAGPSIPDRPARMGQNEERDKGMLTLWMLWIRSW